MYDKVYKGLLGIALLFFAVYLVTRIKVLGALGGIFLLLTALARFFIDLKTDNLPWKKDKKDKKMTYRSKGRN